MHPLVRVAFVPPLLISHLALAQDIHQHGTPPVADPSSAVSTNQSFDTRMAEAMNRMHAAMAAVPTTGYHDRDFLAAMVPHHQGAIDMAKEVLLVTKDSRIRNLAQSIVTAQQYEIELMNTLLADPVDNTLPKTETK
jgi:uncharacterized protein (DUF305 family)